MTVQRDFSLSAFTRVLAIMGLMLTFSSTALAQEKSDQPSAKKMKTKKAKKVNPKAIPGVLKAKGNFSTLLGALKRTGLNKTLKGEGPFTLFAPSDKAFAKLPDGALADMSKGKLKRILQYHIAKENLTSANLGNSVTTSGNPLSVRKQNGHVMIGKATVTKADLKASNGVIHVIDTVLMPSPKKMGTSTSSKMQKKSMKQ